MSMEARLCHLTALIWFMFAVFLRPELFNKEYLFWLSLCFSLMSWISGLIKEHLKKDGLKTEREIKL